MRALVLFCPHPLSTPPNTRVAHCNVRQNPKGHIIIFGTMLSKQSKKRLSNFTFKIDWEEPFLGSTGLSHRRLKIGF